MKSTPKDMLSKEDLIKDRQELDRRVAAMDLEYSTFEAHYKELSEFLDPRRGRFFVEDRNKGDKRFKNIINNAAGRALRRAVAGMHAGIMSPARPWINWTLFDKDLLQDYDVKAWLELFRDVVLMVFNASNAYNQSPLMLRELLVFGTGCMTHVDDFEDVARFYTHTVGSYRVAQDRKLRVNTISRQFQQTTYNLVKDFGLDKVSPGVKRAYDNGNYHTWHTVRHVIEPNPHREADSPFASGKPWRSVYYEEGTKKSKADKELFLKRSGFSEFPAYCPRWITTGEDIYATDCPGMTTLADIKTLQQQEKDLMNAIAKAGSPPLQAPPSFKNNPVVNLPGGVTTNSALGTNSKIESLYQIDPRVQEQAYNIERVEKRINEGFFVDLFMAITEMEGIQPKNQLQLSQINEERLLQIGPALEQVHGEWLERAVQRVAKQVLAAGIMPPAPKLLEGKELDIEFVSALAQAQKSVATAAIERTVNFAGAMAQAGFVGAVDKIDADFAIDRYSDLVGAPAKLIVPTKDAERNRELRNQQQQQMAQLEMAAQAADTMKSASEAKLGDENVLSAATRRQ